MTAYLKFYLFFGGSMKKFLIASLLVLFFGTWVSCGSGSKIKGICNDTVKKAFELCDKNDSGDVQTIIDFYAQIGETISETDVHSATEDSLTDSCYSGLKTEEDVLTNQEVDLYKEGLKTITDCSDLFAYIEARFFGYAD
jgi:hypothetical protein